MNLLLPLIAQADPQAIDAISRKVVNLTWGEVFTFIGLVTAIIGMITGYFTLRNSAHERHRALEEEHKELAEKLKREIAATNEAIKVNIQSPLSVEKFDGLTPRSKHDELAQTVKAHIETTDNRFAAMSRASSESREKIFTLIREENTKIHDRITELLGVVRELKGKVES